MSKNGQIKLRFLLPLTIQCGTCRNYIGRGAKFVSRREDVAGKTYSGVRPVRFYINCCNCSAEITIKTDPQNSDHVVESGAARVHQP